MVCGGQIHRHECPELFVKVRCTGADATLSACSEKLNISGPVAFKTKTFLVSPSKKLFLSDSLNSRQEPIMSWQQYVDTYLIGSGKCAEGAIISAGGDGGIWARSPGLRVTPDEVSKLLRAFVDPGDAATSGIRVGGRKYMFLRSDGDAVYAKERDDGLVAMRTRTALVLALYSKGTVPGECATAVGRVADYLRQHGY
ncbi:similar to actin-binding protein, profilin [Cyanidioschyzon merolae strain 10D]|uniref:Profilin n=1 Tax=Cyanidioschyzon merolae (strain NIES-3377 / 10D) TaxID=280699 RepID=M1UV99_CYAM1|nr:similar to actin-binding protein, profilin [Cyanidioschyzon merolae strain 10D]BAM81841.1 similar to actin-binding protein, profilin [Cyanidioschyzon merolae strain 10D]|eukprot:XP_005537877.1 similar to actin-binding protein, profilin [Cyanidioschyzon merolae strain 10D]